MRMERKYYGDTSGLAELSSNQGIIPLCVFLQRRQKHRNRDPRHLGILDIEFGARDHDTCAEGGFDGSGSSCTASGWVHQGFGGLAVPQAWA
jgi:hypothetical protein